MNTDLMNSTLDAIRYNKFNWDQGTWVNSDGIESGTFEDEVENECNTSYCFAGYVASRDRVQLYDRMYTGEFTASEFFIPSHYDEDESDKRYTTLYHKVVTDGVVEFEVYNGPVVTARSAAIGDLNISNSVADVLFEGDNTLEHLEGVVNTLNAIR